jgi:hypothetical protein
MLHAANEGSWRYPSGRLVEQRAVFTLTPLARDRHRHSSYFL